MGKILIIDDDETFIDLLRRYIVESYPLLTVETVTNPVLALSALRKGGLALLLVDLEMPFLDGIKIVRYAIDAGIDKNRIVVLSGRDAEYLHQHFPMGTCLAVLNKYEVRQKAVLDMIFSALQRKAVNDG